MGLTKIHLKADIFILLIGGEECARIQRVTNASMHRNNFVSFVQPAEEQLREAHGQCSWMLMKGGCSGPGCAFRPLALDATLSESCRLTNDYMLSNSHGATYISLNAKLLEEKSEKFKDECAQAHFWQFTSKARCYRRLGHMLQSA